MALNDQDFLQRLDKAFFMGGVCLSSGRPQVPPQGTLSKRSDELEDEL